MTKILVSNDPTIYLRNSGLAPVTHNKLNASFAEGANKEHRRPLPVALQSNKKHTK